ncbi:chemotaxis protein methyltransferase CheR [Methanosarcina thermophila]|jgi:chemotaxis protein methyltransferase CheR|uniref:protein-glutamate O-methyltransferase n=3 Tax=Methanosarcina thermophila TaxID=2210 RepID=A0A1I6ZH71_METTE|nr:protein-glutamate O-methyltransferase CheR [Methanosarcina thermophila]ALK04870.1 MAG: chemotaxis protein CheR [Methanosarcina sp. 795]AKB13586.1 Chemotaxis protein methyltransferase CheR [Methanosarcina thermophila TM-1]AKB15776.1 Chemotaxis protein methyltransferase CheR [Methanosarcina thermophila CHTI-55]NLU56748.1 protein-glutamate O-methyltransferase CheR [Methanosarcina thermophila]SFT62022.1 chemotaxis protein methyltransferase CheR [Methanosarcina thermophila]
MGNYSVRKASENETNKEINRETKSCRIQEISRIQEIDPGFELLKKIITGNTGFNCEHYKEAHFKRRINVRIRATNSESYGAYLKLLKRDPQEYKFLVDTLTVNVSEFFRNPETFSIIEKEVIPPIVKNRSGSLIRSIRIWSAGCAGGEEAYSLAILLHRVMRSDFDKYKIRIIGTDIDAKSLEKARKGIYCENSLKNLDLSTKERYFVKQGDTYQVIDELKNITRFKHHDLISGAKIDRFDIIVCRNVMIYFKKEIQEKLQLNFYQALEKGGFFIIGKSETLIGAASSLFKPYNTRERLYVKEISRDIYGRDRESKEFK